MTSLSPSSALGITGSVLLLWPLPGFGWSPTDQKQRERHDDQKPHSGLNRTGPLLPGFPTGAKHVRGLDVEFLGRLNREQAVRDRFCVRGLCQQLSREVVRDACHNKNDHGQTGEGESDAQHHDHVSRYAGPVQGARLRVSCRKTDDELLSDSCQRARRPPRALVPRLRGRSEAG